MTGQEKKADTKHEVLEGMREWFLIREKAVADARRDTPHHGVNVYFYVEFLEKANAYVADYEHRNGRLPGQAEYCAAAKNWIKDEDRDGLSPVPSGSRK